MGLALISIFSPLCVFPRLRILRRTEIGILHTFLYAAIRPDHALSSFVYVNFRTIGKINLLTLFDIK